MRTLIVLTWLIACFNEPGAAATLSPLQVFVTYGSSINRNGSVVQKGKRFVLQFTYLDHLLEIPIDDAYVKVMEKILDHPTTMWGFIDPTATIPDSTNYMPLNYGVYTRQKGLAFMFRVTKRGSDENPKGHIRVLSAYFKVTLNNDGTEGDGRRVEADLARQVASSVFPLLYDAIKQPEADGETLLLSNVMFVKVPVAIANYLRTKFSPTCRSLRLRIGELVDG